MDDLFRRTSVEARGRTWHLCELSGAAITLVGEMKDEARAGLAMVGLSLCHADGRPLWGPENLEDAIAEAAALPGGLLRDVLARECERLNSEDDSGN